MVSVWPRSRRSRRFRHCSCQMRVQLFPTAEARNRNHEVPPRITDQAFDLALIVALGRAAELIGEQIVTL